MEALYFLIAGVVLYVVSDWLLDRIERSVGRRFEYRSLIFFAILLSLAVTAFWLVRRFTDGG